jgi:hypothetical protein
MKKVVVFSQIDEEILSRLQQDYHVVVLNLPTTRCYLALIAITFF